jgi:hypothetical protein
MYEHSAKKHPWPLFDCPLITPEQIDRILKEKFPRYGEYQLNELCEGDICLLPVTYLDIRSNTLRLSVEKGRIVNIYKKMITFEIGSKIPDEGTYLIYGGAEDILEKKKPMRAKRTRERGSL